MEFAAVPPVDFWCLSIVTLMTILHHRRHTPRRRGIQYAASSRFHHRHLGILDRPPSRTMTNMIVLATHCARVLQIRLPPKRKRAQGRPGARCTRGLMCQMHTAKSAHEHTGSAEAVRPSLRNGFTAYFVLSPARPGLLVTVAPKRREPLRNLTPTIGASGPHDFAVRITRRSSKAHQRPSLPAPTSVTMANAPSLGTGW